MHKKDRLPGSSGRSLFRDPSATKLATKVKIQLINPCPLYSFNIQYFSYPNIFKAKKN